jgi:dihydrodipicolinate synthase/N-acetylneuraminate lyase
VSSFDPSNLIRPRRPIRGISAVLLPYDTDGGIDWASFRSLLARTVDAGLTAAVNMDTGYVNLLTHVEKAAVLDVTHEVLGGAWFVAGAFVGDEPGDAFDRQTYHRETERIEAAGGTPVIFPSYGLSALEGPALNEAYHQLGAGCDRFIAFELGDQFAPFGRIYTLPDVVALMAIPNCIGIKHSSLDRVAEWARLEARNETRPDFTIFTGNDLAIDMVMYGSDYLLGLSAFAPDLFARRDRQWASGDAGFYALNDALQYLGAFAFRDPVPAYKHTAAQFLKIRGWLPSDAPHPRAPRRPDSDRDVLRVLLDRLEAIG